MSTPTTGRRVAVRQRRRPDAGGVLGAVLVAFAVLLLLGAALVEAEPESPGRPTAVPVDQVVTGCLGSPDPASSRATTLAAPLPEGARVGEGGELTAGAPGTAPTAQTAAGRGTLQTLDAARRGSAVVVTATEGEAVGRGTFQVDRMEDGGGLAMQECLAPRARWWFTGGGAALDHESALVLANPDPGPAVVDVVVHGPGGVTEDVGTRGITLAPGEVRTVPLVEVAAQSDELAVHVEASRGRVVAGLADAFATRPAAEPGHEWVPAQAEASRLVRLAPLPRQADRRTLVIANPADREALVDVKVAAESGSFAPAELAQVRVPAQSVVTADLGDAIGQDASAVVLRSPVPVTATVRSSKGSDSSYAAAVPVLDGPAAALVVDDTSAELQLTAGEAGGRATVTAYSTNGDALGSKDLEVSPTATLAWSPPKQTAYVMVVPRRGQLAGGVTMTGDSGLGQVALRPLPVVLRRPVVVPVVR
jgi:hypothetical protein